MKLEKIPYTSREEWLTIRRGAGIGGSEAAAVVGLSPYTSQYRLWLEKTGKITPEDISDREAVRLGNDLEQYVADRFCEATGKRVRKCNFILKNPEFPFAFANPDRLIIGENAGLECKTTSSYDVVTECKNGFPARYLCQCVHYMMVTGADRWYLAVCCFGRGFYWFTLERDQAEVDALANMEREFWDLVEKDTPPEIDGSESTAAGIREYYDTADGSTVDLAPVAEALTARDALKAQIDALKELIQQQENVIQEYMGAAEAGTWGRYKVTWRNGTRRAVDYKKFEADHPGAFDSYKTETTTRTFRVVGKKEK